MLHSLNAVVLVISFSAMMQRLLTLSTLIIYTTTYVCNNHNMTYYEAVKGYGHSLIHCGDHDSYFLPEYGQCIKIFAAKYDQVLDGLSFFKSIFYS